MKIKEQQIKKGIRKGNLSDFKFLYDTFYVRMVRYATSYIGKKEIAEDMVQDIFLKLWEKKEDAFAVSSISSYLFRAVHNACMQYFRHNKVNEKFENQQKLKNKEIEILYQSWGQNEMSPSDFNEISRISEKTLNSLPPKTKEIYSLSRQHLFTHREISEKISVDIKTVEYHITKALRVFKENLKDYLVVLISFFITQ